MMATYSVAIVAFPSSGPSGHLLPDGEKNPENAAIAPCPSGRGWIGRRPRRVKGEPPSYPVVKALQLDREMH